MSEKLRSNVIETVDSAGDPHIRAGDCAATEDRPPSGLLDAGAANHTGHPARPAMDHHSAGLPGMGTELRNGGSRWTSVSTRGNGVGLMPVFKRKYVSGKVVWRYMFSGPGATGKIVGW